MTYIDFLPVGVLAITYVGIYLWLRTIRLEVEQEPVVRGIEFYIEPERAEVVREWIRKKEEELAASQLEYTNSLLSKKERGEELSREEEIWLTFRLPDRWLLEKGIPYTGAIGGGITYSFTPTGLGVIERVKYGDDVLDITEYDSW